MPSDRQKRRAVLLATGIVCSTISTGCFTAPFVRRGTESVPEPGSSAGTTPVSRADTQNNNQPRLLDSSVRNASVRAADVPASAATLATPFLTGPGAPSPAPAAEFPLEPHNLPGASSDKALPREPAAQAPPPQAEPAPPPSTPLLDSYIQRVADVTRQQREAIESSPAPESSDDRKLRQETAPIITTLSAAPRAGTPNSPAPDRDAIPLPEHLSRDPQEDHPARQPIAVTPEPPPRAPDEPIKVTPNPSLLAGTPELPPTPDTGKPGKSEPSLTPKEAREASAVKDFKATAPDESSLGIGDLRLCRRVLGFGSFEPLPSERVKVGQQLLLYCELTGIQYEQRGTDFVSRISSRVEVKPADGGAVLWSRELGDAQDSCRRRRRDYYVNYRIDLPRTLGPGKYRLRLLQTDLVAGSSTSSDIPIEVAP